MKILEEFRRAPDRVLDRLIDGELGTQERRELLASLDDEPGGWRSCALAFLEAQSWRLQLARVASEPILEQVKTAAIVAPGARGAAWESWLAMAASVLVAFAIGTQFPFDRAVEQVPSKLVTQRHASPVTNDAGDPVAKADAATDEAQQLPATLTLTPVDGDGSQTIELPIVESDAARALAAAEEPSSVSRALLQQFERNGFQVNRQQQLWPVELPDGRRVVVPVEEVDIRAPEIERL